MADYQRKPLKFLNRGIEANRPVDLLDPARYPFLKNIRSYIDGTIHERPGLTEIGTQVTNASVHSIHRLNDETDSSFRRFYGVGTVIESGTTGAHPVLDTGWSGRPVSMIPHRPINSSRPYLYMMDGTRARKSNTTPTLYTIGIPAPTQPPSTSLGQPAFITVSDFQSAGSFTAGGTAGAPSTITRLSTTVSQILYDSGNLGWANVSLASFDENAQSGMFLTVGSETVLVHSIYNAISDTTIGSIIYDAGSTGLCTIQLAATTSKKYLKKNALIRVAGAENCRILSVTFGPDGLASIRISTTGARSAGDSVSGLRSFRAFFAGTQSVGASVSTSAVRSSVTEGIGTLSSTTTLNLGVISGRPVEDDDYIAIQVRVDDLTLLTEIRIMLDVDAATNDFTRNYFFGTIRPPDITAAVAQNEIVLTPREARIRRRLFDALRRDDQAAVARLQVKLARIQEKVALGAGEIGSEEGVTGDNQWATIKIKIKDLTRVGSDTSRTLSDVKAIRVNVNCTNTVQVDFDAWWVGGTYGPDVADIGTPYKYRYRYRSTITGEISAWSPETRSGETPHRERVAITPTPSSEAQADRIDYMRFGGAINDWRYVGTGPNSSAIYNDDQFDSVVVENPSPLKPYFAFDNFQTFCVIDLPKTGTCTVAGSKVQRTGGDNFNVNWTEFTEIIIDGISCHLYGSPTSTSVLEIKESIGTRSNVPFYLPEPKLAGQSMPAFWGPFGGGMFAIFMFGCGHSSVPGYLYFTKGNNPDSSSDADYIEVTSPSEPLMNGTIYNGRCYLWSTEQQFLVSPAFGEPNKFVAQPTPAGIGLYARYGVTNGGPKMWWVGKDGIYEGVGGEARCITDAQLYSIFPHDGQVGVSVNGIIPPDFSQPDEMKLEYINELVYFDYKGTDSNYYTLIYDIRFSAWLLDVYTPAATSHYLEEGRSVQGCLVGSSTGRVFSFSGSTDAGSAISCEVVSGSEDFGDSRARKLIGDAILDFLTGSGVTLNVALRADNNQTTLTTSPANFTSILTRSQRVVEINSGEGATHRNLSIRLTWNGAATLYEWQPAFIIKPEDIGRRRTDWDDLGFKGAKWVQGLRVHLDTGNIAKDFKVQSDRGVNGAPNDEQTFTVTSNGESVVGLSFDAAFICHLVRIIGVDDDSWRLFDHEFVFEPEPEAVEEWEPQPQSFGLQGYLHIPRLQIPLRSSATVTLTVDWDGGFFTDTYSIPSTGGSLKKNFVTLKARKGKVAQLKLSGGGNIRVYQKDVECWIKAWGSDGSYQIVKPFGHPHATQGALI